MPYNQKQGIAKRESRLKRALLAAPFLLISYVAMAAMNPTTAFPWIGDFIKNGTVTWKGGSAPIRFSFYGWKVLDEL
jgi:hypothetical protein